MSYTAKGFLFKKFDTEQKTDKFSIRQFVVKIETKNKNYPEYVPFQLMNDRCELIDNIEEGTEVEVSFDIKGREWQGKYFGSLAAWKCVSTNILSKNSKAQTESSVSDDNGNLPF